LSDLLVQARYNHSHDLPVIAQEAAAGKTPDEQVNPAKHIGLLGMILLAALPRSSCCTASLHQLVRNLSPLHGTCLGISNASGLPVSGTLAVCMLMSQSAQNACPYLKYIQKSFGAVLCCNV